jgi:hypothetical protein
VVADELAVGILDGHAVWFRHCFDTLLQSVVGRRGRPDMSLCRRGVEIEVIVGSVKVRNARAVVVDAVGELVRDGFVVVGEGVSIGARNVVIAHGRVVPVVHEVSWLEGHLRGRHQRGRHSEGDRLSARQRV